MPGIFSRLKTWVAGEVLTHSDLNAEFDNIIANAQADKLDGASHNLSEMQSVEDPAPSGTPDVVQPISIFDEIKRLRYTIKRIIGKSNWYDTPDRSLTTVYEDAAHIFSPKTDGSYQDTGISKAVQAGIYDLNGYADIQWRGAAKFGSFGLQNTPGTGPHCYYLDPGRIDSASNGISLWFKNFAAGDTIIYNPHINLHVYLNINGYITADLTLATLTGGAKTVKSIVGSTSLAGSATFKHLLVSYSLKNSVNDYIKVYIDGTLVGSVEQQMKVGLPKKNERVFLMGSNTGKTVSYTMTNSVVPESDGWTISAPGVVTIGGSGSVSDGILTFTPEAAKGRVYSKSTPATSGAVWYEYKFRISELISSQTPAASTIVNGYFSSFINNNFNGTFSTEGHELIITANQIMLMPFAPGFPDGYPTLTSANTGVFVDFDSSDWTVVAVAQDASKAYLYVNGMLKGSVTSTTSGGNSDLSNKLGFGVAQSPASGLAKTQIEYFRTGTGSYSISANSSQTQQISDICLISGGVSDPDLISSLTSSSPFDLFGKEQNTRNTDNQRVGFLGGAASAKTTYLIGNVKSHSDGKNPIRVTSSVSCRASTSGTNFLAYKCFLYATPSGVNADGITAIPGQFLDTFNSSGNGCLTADLPAIINSANSSFMSNSKVYPAGEVNFNLYVYNPNATSNPALQDADITLSQ